MIKLIFLSLIKFYYIAKSHWRKIGTVFDQNFRLLLYVIRHWREHQTSHWLGVSSHLCQRADPQLQECSELTGQLRPRGQTYSIQKELTHMASKHLKRVQGHQTSGNCKVTAPKPTVEAVSAVGNLEHLVCCVARSALTLDWVIPLPSLYSGLDYICTKICAKMLVVSLVLQASE